MPTTHHAAQSATPPSPPSLRPRPAPASSLTRPMRFSARTPSVRSPSGGRCRRAAGPVCLPGASPHPHHARAVCPAVTCDLPLLDQAGEVTLMAADLGLQPLDAAPGGAECRAVGLCIRRRLCPARPMLAALERQVAAPEVADFFLGVGRGCRRRQSGCRCWSRGRRWPASAARPAPRVPGSRRHSPRGGLAEGVV